MFRQRCTCSIIFQCVKSNCFTGFKHVGTTFSGYNLFMSFFSNLPFCATSIPFLPLAPYFSFFLKTTKQQIVSLILPVGWLELRGSWRGGGIFKTNFTAWLHWWYFSNFLIVTFFDSHFYVIFLNLSFC